MPRRARLRRVECCAPCRPVRLQPQPSAESATVEGLCLGTRAACRIARYLSYQGAADLGCDRSVRLDLSQYLVHFCKSMPTSCDGLAGSVEG